MLPLIGIPKTIAKFLKQYRNVFCKEAGFQHISRYINGLLMSPNKTLQGIYSQLVQDGEEKVSRRAMHEAVFEAGWKYEKLMEQHRRVISPIHQGRREWKTLGDRNRAIAQSFVEWSMAKS